MRIRKFWKGAPDQLLRSVSWLALGELLHRVMRLGTVVVLARVLSAYEYGLIAIVFLTIEFANVFTLQGGITGKLIHASEQELDRVANTAYWMNWIIFTSIFCLQCLAAFPIAWFYDNPRLISPICVVAAVYLVIPLFAVQGALIQRESRMKIVALAGVVNSLISNTLTIGFAIAGFGIWSVVLAHALSHVSWWTIYHRNHAWRPQKPTLAGWREILWFAKDPIGIELLDKLRANLDYLLIGHFIGVEQLGVYYFAFNAGLGISLNIIKMFSVTLLPYFCAVRDDLSLLKHKYFSGLKTIAAVTFPLVVLQSSLAQFYVPLVFGQKWLESVPILVVICLSALPRPFASAAEQLLVSQDQGWVGLRWNLIFTTLFALALLFAVQWDIYIVAVCVFVVHLFALPLFTTWTTQRVFFRSCVPSIK